MEESFIKKYYNYDLKELLRIEKEYIDKINLVHYNIKNNNSIDNINEQIKHKKPILKKCPRCKNSNINMNMIQDRRGDEGMTSFFICNKKDCQYTWKEKN